MAWSPRPYCWRPCKTVHRLLLLPPSMPRRPVSTHYDLARVIDDKFWASVDKTDGCWNWTGLCMSAGYGVLRFPGPRLVLCHRFVWWVEHGEWPDVVMHTCDNRRCIRFDHLRGASQLDNIADMMRKGRNNRGEDRPNAKLTEAAVVEMRRRYSGVPRPTQRELAAEFGVVEPIVSRVLNRKIWKHLP